MLKKLPALIIFISIGLLFIILYMYPKTPLAALEKEYMHMEESKLRYSELIKKIDISQEESLLFYINANGNVNCAVAKRGLIGYKIIDVCAELSSYNEELRVGLYGSTYDKGSKWLYFGIIYDGAVEKVVWNNTEGIRFSASNMDMVYAVGDGFFEDDEYYLYDASGNKLGHWR